MGKLTKAPTLGLLLFLLLVLGARGHTLQAEENVPSENATTESSTADAEEAECTAHSIEEFPDDLFTLEQRRQGAFLFHAFFELYCFLLTAYVCNDYLLPALDCICADLRISPDVAGATFLAAASCFPELFVNVVGTFLTESDLGVGTVVGGAIFNTFATPAVGALFAAQGIQLQWHILSRDCVIYILSVGVLVVVMWDNLITLHESMILLLLFTGYFTLLFVNDNLVKFFRRIFGSSTVKPVAETNGDVNPKAMETVKHENYAMPFGTYKPYFHGELMMEYRNSLCKIKAQQANGEVGAIPPPDLEVYTEPESIFVWPTKSNGFEKLWFLFTWPLKILLFLTIPDIRYKRLRKYYPVTFFLCVIWIAISSYLVSWMTTVLGNTIGIPDSVMGITFLSAGGNLPEMVSIVTLSRQGYGDMAMSNTLGANTLDILLCLGLPWAIKSIISGEPVTIVSTVLVYSNVAIIFCVMAFYAVTAFCGFILNKKVGLLCLGMYSVFLIFGVMLELNVFFVVNLPMCD